MLFSGKDLSGGGIISLDELCFIHLLEGFSSIRRKFLFKLLGSGSSKDSFIGVLVCANLKISQFALCWAFVGWWLFFGFLWLFLL